MKNLYQNPWLLLGILIIALLMLTYYMKKESQLSFQFKLKLIKICINTGLFIIGLMLAFGALVIMPIILLIFSQSVLAGVMYLLFALGLLALYMLPVIKLLKAYFRLMKHLSNEEFFIDENVSDVKIIAQCTNRLLLINLFFLLLNCIITLGTGSILSTASNDFGFESWTGQFLAVLLLNLISVLFAKSTEIYKENRLTI